MEVRNLVYRNNLFEADITVHQSDESLSTEYRVGKSTFQIRSIPYTYNSNDYYGRRVRFVISIRFKKEHHSCKENFTLSLNSSTLKIKNTILKEEDSWRIISSANEESSFDLSATITMISEYKEPTRINYSPNLLEDSDFTDFELKGIGGSIHVHRCILAIYSPVLKSMLQNAWKETAEGSVDLTDTSIETLEDFKQFIYLEKIPDNFEHLMKLLLLAKYYMISHLEVLCIRKLISVVNKKSILKLLEFSFAQQFPDLICGLLKYVQKSDMDITSVCANYAQESCKLKVATYDKDDKNL